MSQIKSQEAEAPDFEESVNTISSDIQLEDERWIKMFQQAEADEDQWEAVHQGPPRVVRQLIGESIEMYDCRRVHDIPRFVQLLHVFLTIK